MSQLDSGDSIFCLSEQGIRDVSEAIELYEEALNQVRTELTDWVDSVSSKNQEIRDILVMLLKPIRNRFTFHFILNGHTNTISAPSLYNYFFSWMWRYLNYMKSFLNINVPFIIQVLQNVTSVELETVLVI